MFLRSDPGLPAPDLQFMFIHVPFHPPTLEAPENSYTVAIVLIRPTSRGWVKLHSADSDAPPLINSNYLDDDADVRRLLLGIEKAHELHAADAFAEWRAREVLPGESPSEVDLRDFIARDANTYYHPVGSCRMGINEAAVVDPELKVHGLDGLWVADVCIMPTIVSANTNPSFIMIGAKAADLVPGTVRGAGTVQTA